MRRFWKFVNRLFIVPMFRLGLGPLFGNPISGYVIVLRTVGRKTGRVRYTPVTYCIADGSVYCLAGYGRTADWYRNAIANPEIGVIMPGGTIEGRVEEVADAGERLAMTRQIFRNAGLMGFTEGFNPFRASDHKVRMMTSEMPVLRVRAIGIAAGPSDPGGWAWVWTPLLIVGFVVAILVLLR